MHICLTLLYNQNSSNQSVKYWQVAGVTAPLSLHLLMIGHTPHGHLEILTISRNNFEKIKSILPGETS